MISNPNWKKRLDHDRTVRDALVVCGNKKPTMPDPPGGLVLVEGRVFNGKVFHAYLDVRGHTTAKFETCKCFER